MHSALAQIVLDTEKSICMLFTTLYFMDSPSCFMTTAKRRLAHANMAQEAQHTTARFAVKSHRDFHTTNIP